MKIVFIFLIVFKFCLSQVSINDGRHDVKDPDVRSNEFRNFLHADINPSCPLPNVEFIIKWTASQLDEQSLKEIKTISFEWNQNTLIIPQNFDVGLYNFSVTVWANQSACFTTTTSADYTFVKLIKSPLVVVLIEGKTSQFGLTGITVTQQDNIYLKPGLASFRRGFNSITTERNFTKIEYFCRMINESYPTLENGKIDNVNVVGPDPSLTNGLLGCFKQGPGKLSFNSSSVSLPASKLTVINAIYEFRADVYTLDNLYTGYAYVHLTNFTGKSFTVYITPKNPTINHQTDNGISVNPQVQNVFFGSYADDEIVSTPQYQWSIYSFDKNNTFYPVSLISNFSEYVSSLNTMEIIIRPTFFLDFSNHIRFGLKLKVTSKNRPPSESLIFLTVNHPPSGGDCNVETDGFETMLFSINCSDWYDDDGIASYLFYVRNTEKILSTFYWTPKNVKTHLFLGPSDTDYIYDIYVNVTDNYGVSTTYFTENVKILPSKNNYTWTANEIKKMMAQKSYQQLPSLVLNFADLLQNSNNFDGGICPEICASRVGRSCVVSDEQDCSISFDEYSVIYCQQRKYLCLDADHLQCVYCAPGTNFSDSSCELLKKFDCGSLTGVIQQNECSLEKSSCSDTLDDQIQQQIGQIISFCSQMELIGIEDIFLQTSTISYLLQASEYKISLIGVQSLYDIFLKSVTTFKIAAPNLNSAMVKRVFESLLKQTAVLIKCINILMKNPGSTDRIKATRDRLMYYDPTLPINPADIKYDELMSPWQFGFAAFNLYIKKIASGVANSVNFVISDSLSGLINSMIGETVYHTLSLDDEIELFVYKNKADKLLPNSKNEYSGNEFKIILPQFCILANVVNCNSTQEIALVISHFKQNLYKYADLDNILTSGSTKIQIIDLVTDQPISTKSNFDNMIDLFQNSHKRKILASPVTNENGDDDDGGPVVSLMVYYNLTYNISKSALIINVAWTNPGAKLKIFIGVNKVPDIITNTFDFSENLTSNSSSYTLFLNDTILNGFVGPVILGIAQFGVYNDTLKSAKLKGFLLASDITPHELRTYLIVCRNMNSTTTDASNCHVGPLTTADVIHCRCNQIQTLSSGLLNPKTVVQTEFNPSVPISAKNVAIFITLFVMLGVWLMVVMWAQYRDREDIIKLGVTPLPDNDPMDGYYYEIVVSTGGCIDAGTDSKVYFKLHGPVEETDIRHMTDPFRPLFRRGQVDRFLMTVPRSVGDLVYLHIWHDNSGKGQFASWYINHITFIDLQTRDKYQFVVDRWLAVEKEDGRIDVVVPIANYEEKTAFRFLMPCHLRRLFVEYHLWLSVFTRPVKSRFTCVQRCCCCLLTAYLSMITSGCWYKWLVENNPNPNIFTFGPFNISFHEILVGFLAPLFPFPIILLICTLFRRSQWRKSHAVKIQEHVEEKLEENLRAKAREVFDYSYVKGGSKVRHGRIMNVKQFVYPEFVHKLNSSSSVLDFTFPWWFIGIGWLVLLAGIVGSFALMVIYLASPFDDYMTKRWTTSIVVSIFSSIFITQPMKIILLSLIYSWIKKPIEDDSDDNDFYVAANTNQYVYDPKSPPRYVDPHIFDADYLAHCRERRMKELKMYDILREVIIYTIFLAAVTVVAYLNRSPWAPLYSQQLTKLFVGGPKDLTSMTNVKTPDDFWRWADVKLANGLRAQKWYNEWAQIGDRGFLADRTSRIIGFATMRQIRTKTTGCMVPYQMSQNISYCYTRSYGNEDTNNYSFKWQQNSQPVQPEFTYRPADLMGLMRICGKVDCYSGGGYVADLIWSSDELRAKFVQLKNERWIDERTRAIVVEFAVYNGHINLFAVVQILFEFPPSGGIISTTTVQPIKLYRYEEMRLLKLVCEITFCVFVIIFTFKECRNFIRQGFYKYFNQFWNYIEVSITVNSYVAFFAYFNLRFMEESISRMFQITHGNLFVSLRRAAVWYDFFNTIVAFVMFFAVIKFGKLLRFDYRLSIVMDIVNALSSELAWFAFIIVVTFVAYISFFYLSSIGYVSGDLSFFFNHVDMRQLFNSDSYLVPVVYFFYVITMVMILKKLGVVLFVTMTKVIKRNVLKRSRDFELLDRMLDKWRMMVLGKSRYHERLPISDQWREVSVLKSLETRVDLLCGKVVKFDDENLFVERRVRKRTAIKIST